MDKVQIWGIPSNLPTDKAAVFRSRLLLAYNDIRPLLSEPLPIISIGDIRQKQQPEASPSGEKKVYPILLISVIFHKNLCIHSNN